MTGVVKTVGGFDPLLGCWWHSRKGFHMSIGAGIALFVIGAILAFAVNLPNDYVSLSMIGYIMMGAGVVVFLIGVILLVRRRQTDTVTRTEGAGGAQVTRSTTRSANDDLV